MLTMSYITRTGNLAATPVLRENDKGKPYTYARVLVTDRIRKDDGNYEDGGTIGYDVAVQGNQAVNLVIRGGVPHDRLPPRGWRRAHPARGPGR